MRRRQLDGSAIARFADAGEYEQLIAGLARAPPRPPSLIERLMQNIRYDGILVACKAAELRWPTFNAILKTRFAPYEMLATNIAQAQTDFLKLSAATAQRMLRF